MALGELLVSLAAVKRWVLLLQIQSSRTGRLVPVWIGCLHPVNVEHQLCFNISSLWGHFKFCK